MGGGCCSDRISDVLMNKSSLEKQTGLKALRSGNNYLLAQYVDDCIFKRVIGLDGFCGSESKAWQRLFDEWWRTRREEALLRDNYRCVRCGRSSSLSVDHIVNRSQGGDSSMENLQTLCVTCHDKKTNNVS